jgi:hypothetical protein
MKNLPYRNSCVPFIVQIKYQLNKVLILHKTMAYSTSILFFVDVDAKKRKFYGGSNKFGYWISHFVTQTILYNYGMQ